MVSVQIGCSKCGKRFRKHAASVQFIAQTVDAFSHCDPCEEEIRADKKNGGVCDLCTHQPRNKPFAGELRQYIYPMFDFPKHYPFCKFFTSPNGIVHVYDTRPKAIEKAAASG